MTDYSYSISSERAGCDCREEVALLQHKLTEVHAKLMAQIEVCREQESRIIILQRQAHQGHGEIYDTFGRKANNKENLGANRQEESHDGVQIKNDLLQADLEAMRHRVLTEITEKNHLLEEMGDLKKRHRRELALEVKKFEGLEILYRKVASDKGLPLQDYSKGYGKAEAEAERLARKVQELEGQLHSEREKQRRVGLENQQLRTLVEELEKQAVEMRQDARQSRPKPTSSEDSSDQLREIDSLKQQISRINKNISQREQEFKRGKSDRRGIEEEEPADTASMETKLVGEPRWGRRHY